MSDSTKDTVSFSIENKDFYRRINPGIAAAMLGVLVLISIIACTSKQPIQDSVIGFLFCALFFFGILIYPHITSIYNVTFEDESILLLGNKFNVPFKERIAYKDVRLSVYELGKFRLEGYEMKIKQKDKKGYTMGENNGWNTLTLYYILKEIRERRCIKTIYREDGTYFIEDIERYLKGKK